MPSSLIHLQSPPFSSFCLCPSSFDGVLLHLKSLIFVPERSWLPPIIQIISFMLVVHLCRSRGLPPLNLSLIFRIFLLGVIGYKIVQFFLTFSESFLVKNKIKLWINIDVNFCYCIEWVRQTYSAALWI